MTADPTPAAVAVEALPFDEAYAQLTATIAELEAGGQPLEATITLYERAVALQRHCERLLADAQLRVSQLVAQAGGGLAVEPVHVDDTTPEPLTPG